MGFDSYLAALNGYLKALQRLSGNGFIYHSKKVISHDGDIDKSVGLEIESWSKENLVEFRGKSEISYKDLKSEVSEFVFAGILSQDRIGDEKISKYLDSVLFEDINEYFGLAASSLGSDAQFHPLVKGPIYLLSIDHKSFVDSIFFLVEIGEHFVLTYFCRRV
jgi:hypothetical protein